MRVSSAAILAACLAVFTAAAEEGAPRAEWHTDAMPAQKPAAKSAPESSAASGRAERVPLMTLKPATSCVTGEFEACLDPTGRLTLPGARRYLPELPGLKPERLTVKRSGIVLGYSF